jgi:putative spermidine/putrescine transport system ATP-binding protein
MNSQAGRINPLDAPLPAPVARTRAPADQPLALELHEVCKRYGTVQAVSSIDLFIRRGEFVTLLGPSGSGKTTLLNLLAGSIAPTSGRIHINGTDATRLAPGRRDIGMVFQNYALMPHMTVFENIAFPLRVRKLPASEIRRRVTEVLDVIQLPDVGDRKPRELSGGQQQRISLARCIVYNPAVILMDEPLGALDKKLRDQMQLEIKRLHMRLGITVLYVTHDQEEALTMSDRIVLLNRGQVEQIDAPDELYFHPRSVFAAEFLGHSNLFSVQVREAQGQLVHVESTQGNFLAMPPAFPVRDGDSMTAMVRPENMSIHEGKAPSLPMNRVNAVAVDSIILGGVIRYHVQLPDGGALTVTELNRAGRTRLKSGSITQIMWRPEDTLLLPNSASVR